MAKFVLVNKETGVALNDDKNNIYRPDMWNFYGSIFVSREQVQEHLNYLKSSKSYKPYEIKVYVLNSLWKPREQERFESGEYTNVTWANETWWKESKYPQLHFTHVAEKEPANVAFTESPEKGMDSIKTSIKPGKYLERYFKDILTASQIKQWSEKHKDLKPTVAITSRIKWATKPEDIARVYSMVASFGSCMQGNKDKFSHGLPYHPAYAYGAGDLELAYITHLKDDKQLIARALVLRNDAMREYTRAHDNIDTHRTQDNYRVGRVYGDDNLFRRELAKDGIITEATNDYFDSMKGAKLLQLKHKTGHSSSDKYTTFILPYIDSCPYIKIDGDYLVLDENNYQFVARSTEGTSGRIYVSDKSGKVFCDLPYRVVVELVNGEYINSSNFRFETWSSNEVADYGFVCNISGQWFSKDKFTTIKLYESKNYIHTACAEIVKEGKDYFICAITNKPYLKRYITQMGDGTYWNNEYFNSNGFISNYDKKGYPDAVKGNVAGMLFTIAQIKQLFYFDKSTQKWTTNKKNTAKDDLFHDLICGDSNLDIADEILFDNKYVVADDGQRYLNKRYDANEMSKLIKESENKHGHYNTLKYKSGQNPHYYVVCPANTPNYNGSDPRWPKV